MDKMYRWNVAITIELQQRDTRTHFAAQDEQQMQRVMSAKGAISLQAIREINVLSLHATLSLTLALKQDRPL
jgi:hypothetical protein